MQYEVENPYLSYIVVYPLKSAGGIVLQKAEVGPRGLKYDRRWMVVDKNLEFISQRKFPRMATVSVSFTEDSLLLSAPDYPQLQVPFLLKKISVLNVRIWNDICMAYSCGKEPAEWISTLLETECRLVYMPDVTNRPVDKQFTSLEKQVSFADSFPFLIISEASLQDLNNRMSFPLPMDRFRPNLVVTGCPPYDEDSWKIIEIGTLRLHVVKSCSRCVITTIDQNTGEAGKEPLRTLAGYRRKGDKVFFGQNAVHENETKIEVKDRILIRSRKKNW
jgi:uncharacterized protein YcbX